VISMVVVPVAEAIASTGINAIPLATWITSLYQIQNHINQ
jgi:hypothetical protein